MRRNICTTIMGPAGHFKEQMTRPVSVFFRKTCFCDFCRRRIRTTTVELDWPTQSATKAILFYVSRRIEKPLSSPMPKREGDAHIQDFCQRSRRVAEVALVPHAGIHYDLPKCIGTDANRNERRL